MDSENEELLLSSPQPQERRTGSFRSLPLHSQMDYQMDSDCEELLLLLLSSALLLLSEILVLLLLSAFLL